MIRVLEGEEKEKSVNTYKICFSGLKQNSHYSIVQFIPCVCVISCFSSIQLCNPMDCSPPGSSVHGILQARILEWVAIPFSPGDLPDAEIEPVFLCPLHWQAGSLPFAPPGKPIYYVYVYIFAYVLYIYSIYLSTYFWPHYGVWGILVPRPGIKPTPPAVELQSLPLDHQGSP